MPEKRPALQNVKLLWSTWCYAKLATLPVSIHVSRRWNQCMMELLIFPVSIMLYWYELEKNRSMANLRINYLVYIIGCVQDEEWCCHVIQEILWKHALHKYKTNAITIWGSNKKRQIKQTEKLNRRLQQEIPVLDCQGN